MFFKIILTIIIGYLLGCISAAYLIGKKFGHIDIRQYGSGNAGATNMLRTMGIKYAAPTLILDTPKSHAGRERRHATSASWRNAGCTSPWALRRVRS